MKTNVTIRDKQTITSTVTLVLSHILTFSVVHAGYSGSGERVVVVVVVVFFGYRNSCKFVCFCSYCM